jgi:hypothetical protein
MVECPNTMKLEAQIVTAASLDGRQRDRMFALMEQYYAGMKRDGFEADLNEKRWVIVLRERSSAAICGFSTQMILDFAIDGAPMHALFSGDTIVDRRCWGQSLLAQTWGRLAMTLIDEYQDGSLYWFLISKGYKTYRFLPLFFREFYPRYDAPTPPWARAAIEVLARGKYPHAFDPAAGIICAEPRGYRLRDGVAAITPGRLRDPHVKFFAARNPGHNRGEELCCIAPLNRDNFTAAAARPLRAPILHWSAAE